VHALGRPPQNGTDLLERDPVLQEALFLSLLQRGVYTAPRGSLNLGLAITEWDIDHYLNALDDSLAELSDAM
jgi:glutamate-1-semialdehyde 2,1-aminomutase